MSINARDTQFLGFARGLWKDLETNIDFIPEGRTMRKTFLPMVERIIAQHAYGLACHVSTHTILSSHGDMGKIPDMPVLPEVSNE
jgi:hypothetical protein